MEKGDFKNCLLHGYRERMFRNGSVEKGEFKNGVLHGCGLSKIPIPPLGCLFSFFLSFCIKFFLSKIRQPRTPRTTSGPHRPRADSAPAGHFETFAKNASYMGGLVKDGLKNIRTKKRRRAEPAEDAVT